MQALTNLHPRLRGAIPRYAVLRWTIGGESDCWFWRRFHKLGPCICGCGRLADTYPFGLAQAPLAEHHYAEYLNPPAHTHADYDTIAQATLPPNYAHTSLMSPHGPTREPTTNAPATAQPKTMSARVSCVVLATTVSIIGCDIA